MLRLGSFPPRNSVFNGEVDSATASDGWIGDACTASAIRSCQEKIKLLADEVGVKVSEVFTAGGEENCRTVLLLRIPPTSVSNTPEVRCAVVGNVDSGKSTTLGVLTRGGLDDGRGRARVGLFRHKHEIETGRTSSVGMEVR
jgi:GTPase